MLVEHSVCHEPISVFINVYAPCLVLVEHSVGSNTNNALAPHSLVHCTYALHSPKERGCTTANGVIARYGRIGFSL